METPHDIHEHIDEWIAAASARGLNEEELGAFILKAEKMKDELQTQYHENAKLQNPEEFRIVEKIDYKRIHFGGLQQNMARQRASDIEPPDSLGQMEAAAKTQKLWYTTTDDWDTHQRYEEDYEQLNPTMKRWLQRVKPYRYSQQADQNASQGVTNE